uniref:KIAA1549 like n=1 Tax=Cyprinus carpio carpio TaxID=630221 RepID=A0A9J7YAJ2_CYPCA
IKYIFNIVFPVYFHLQIERISSVPNVTVGYYVTRGAMVYTASVVLEALSMYGIERLMADIRQFVPLVQAIPIPAVPWRPSPAISLMLKTVLRFVGPGDDLRSCRFTQMMEQRLENAFAEAEAIVMNSHSSLTVQILSTSQSIGSPAVSLIYVVYNGSVTLNGTTASDLLSQLTAELVGYFLFYPPLITAEPLEYHNLNTSVVTRPFWIITVIQDVENSSLEGQYHSFASLMEERLAELFMVAHQQGVRFKRAATVGSYTVQMVSIRRVNGPKNPAEMTYYVQQNGTPLLGTSAAKLLNTVDSQTMALTLGYFVQLQAEAVVKNPPNNLWIIAAVLAPIGVVTLIIIIITTVLCHKNKSDFKSDPIGNVNPRVKPVQGFDYAKQHLGQQGGDEETLPVTQETMVLPHPIRDAPLSLDKPARQDGSTSKKSLNSAIRKRLLSEDGSVISSKSVKEVSGKGSGVQKATTQQKLPKEELRKSNGEKFYVFLFLADHYDSSSGSLQLISIKPIAAPPTYSCPASSDRSQDSAVFNGEVNFALKQKSDIEHYRNKLRLKAKRKGYYGIPSAEGKDSTKDLSQQHKYSHDRPPHPQSRAQALEDDRGSTFVKPSQVSHPTHRSRQSLNSPSPGGTEMDLLVMRERPRKGIRNSGYDTEPEIIEETDVDQLADPHYFGCGRQIKGQSETSTLSSQPSIDEVRQQMHLLLEEAFSLASAGHSASSRHHHSHHQHPPLGPYGLGPVIPYSEVVTSAPGTTSQGLGGLQWVPAYRPDPYQCSLAKQAFRFTQLPEMALGSPPPPVPPRTGPPPELSLQRSLHFHILYSAYIAHPYETLILFCPTGNPMTAVYAIPASHTGYTGYFISTPPSSYHSPSWMSYPPEPEDVLPQWTESMPLPGYTEAFPHPHYPQGSPLLWHHRQAIQGGPNNPPSSSTAVSQQSLAEPGNLVSPDTPLSSLSTSALVKAIRDEVAKLAKKQADMCEFQV